MALVNRVLPAAELASFVQAQAAKLAALPASSVRITKQLMKSGMAGQINRQMEEEGAHFRRMLTPCRTGKSTDFIWHVKRWDWYWCYPGET